MTFVAGFVNGALVATLVAWLWLRDKAVIPPELFRKPVMPAKTPLTDRQAEALMLAAKGFSNQEIADMMGVTLQTVKYHLSAVYERLEVKNRAGAIHRARELGVLI